MQLYSINISYHHLHFAFTFSKQKLQKHATHCALFKRYKSQTKPFIFCHKLLSSLFLHPPAFSSNLCTSPASLNKQAFCFICHLQSQPCWWLCHGCPCWWFTFWNHHNHHRHLCIFVDNNRINFHLLSSWHCTFAKGGLDKYSANLPSQKK